ncbi:MAG: PorV/PorQ family protein [Mangrovibacterium sp.]
MTQRLLITTILILFAFMELFAQGSVTGSNTISTAVPFLTIAPDSRSAAMGDAGVATSPDVNAQFWNAAKYAFSQQQAGIGISYVPWMRKMTDDMSLSYLSGFYRLDERQCLSASMRYFALGSFVLKDEYNSLQAERNPNEFAIDFAYSRKLGETWSASVAFRYIRSNLAGESLLEDAGWPANAL